MSCLDGGSLLGSRGGVLRGWKWRAPPSTQVSGGRASLGIDEDLPPFAEVTAGEVATTD